MGMADLVFRFVVLLFDSIKGSLIGLLNRLVDLFDRVVVSSGKHG
jgi:hypothetical protein